MTRVSIIVVTWAAEDVLPACLASIHAQDYDGEVEVLVWDNDSHDATVSIARSAGRGVRVLPSPKNVGFARGNNAAAREADGDLFLFLNPDTVMPRHDVLRRWVQAHKAQIDTGMSAPRLLNADGSIQPSVALFTSPLNTLILGFGLHKLMSGSLRDRWAPRDGSPSSARDVEWVKGAAVMISRSLFFTVGGWSEDTFMYAEDQELCWSVRNAGYRVSFCPAIEVVHLDDHAANKRWSDVERTERVARATVGMLCKRYGRPTATFTLVLLTARHGFRAVYFCARGSSQVAAAHLASARIFARASWETMRAARSDVRRLA
jgi:N-acetylglucosaminyl-diphospho-decaprenol L-rhamnosyltransferase